MGWILLISAVTQPMFLSDYQGFPASEFVLNYLYRAVMGLIWCSTAAAIGLRLWAVIALAFHGVMAVGFAQALSMADVAEGRYGWDAKPEAIATVLNQIGLASWGLAVIVGLSLIWKYARRPGKY